MSLLAEGLRRRIVKEVKEKIWHEWGVRLRQEKTPNDDQQMTEDIDEEMLSPGMSQMSESLSSVSLEPSAQNNTHIGNAAAKKR